LARHSLKGSKIIQSLLKSGKGRRSGHLILYHQRLPEFANDYAGAYLIPKSAGTAVERNRLKRWLREDFRLLQKEHPIYGAFIVRFSGTAAEVVHGDLSESLKKLMESI